eukprot:gene3585-6320_t
MEEEVWNAKNVKEKLIAHLKSKTDYDFKKLLGDDPSKWVIKELIDGVGNLNYIYFIEGERNSLVIKWAPPYVRVVGESWSLDPIRGKYESEFLKCEHAPKGSIPELYYFDEEKKIICMENLKNTKNLKYELIKGIKFPKLSEQMSDYYSQMLFKTSGLYLKQEEIMKKAGYFSGNHDLCHLTQEVVFQQPFYTHNNNSWTNGLDDIVKEVQADKQMKFASLKLLDKFRSYQQCLVHGDLHTGSIMVNQERTAIIDGEFCVYGPMGFDLGLFIAHLFISFFSQTGLATSEDDRKDMQKWILNTITTVWNDFKCKFLKLWETEHKGDLYLDEMIQNDKELLTLIQNDYFKNLFDDTIGYASLAIIRRVHGIASNADMLAIKDETIRAQCERRQLKFGRELLIKKFDSIESVCELAKSLL